MFITAIISLSMNPILSQLSKLHQHSSIIIIIIISIITLLLDTWCQYFMLILQCFPISKSHENTHAHKMV
jgi:hypothetical protein